MEGAGSVRAMSCLMVVFLLLGSVYAEQSNKFRVLCFAKCFPWTCKKVGLSLEKCAVYCGFKCSAPPGALADAPIDGVDIVDEAQYYCNLGCASHLCVPLSTPRNPALEQVKGCVDNCGLKCRKKN